MAIGTAAAIGIGLAGAGAVAGSISSNKASKRAAQVSQDNNAANVALQREIYGQNKEILSPFVQRGNAAGNAINALLGLGGTQATPTAQPNALAQWQGYNPDTSGQVFGMGDNSVMGAPLRGPGAQWFDNGVSLAGEGQYGPAFGTAFTGQTPGFGGGVPQGQPPQQGGATARQAAEDAFDIFRDSTGYKFRLGQGMDAINSGYAGAGTLQSGAAMKAINEYGQNFASNEFGNYMGMLGNQQAAGVTSGGALAGVGIDFANNVSRENTMNAANQANALTSRQSPIANVLGTLGGGLFKYGMK